MVVAPPAPPPVSVVRVTLRDASLALQPTLVPTGRVVFTVVNRGAAKRRFVVGRARTRVLAPGATAALPVLLREAGPHALAAVGRRQSQLAALLDVFAPCPKPQSSTVRVQLAQEPNGVTLSQTTIPCGSVTFVVTNVGSTTDSFRIAGVPPNPKAATRELGSGQSATLTVRFVAKGAAYYQSDFPQMEPEFGGGDGEGGRLTIA